MLCGAGAAARTQPHTTSMISRDLLVGREKSLTIHALRAILILALVQSGALYLYIVGCPVCERGVTK